MTLCCQVTNYPINALERKYTLPTQGQIIFLAQWEVMEHTHAGRESVRPLNRYQDG